MAVEQLASRLGSSVQEVRLRASSALIFKLANGLLTPQDFQAPEVLQPVAAVLVQGDEGELEASVLRIAITVCADDRVAQLFARLCPRAQLADIAASRSLSLRPLYDQLIDRVPDAPEAAQPSTQPAPPAAPSLDPLRRSTPALRVPTLRSHAGNAMLRASMSSAAPAQGESVLSASHAPYQRSGELPGASASPLAADMGSFTPHSAYTPDVAFMREPRPTTSLAAPSGSRVDLAATAPARAGGAGSAQSHKRAGGGMTMPDVMPSMLFSAPPVTPSSEAISTGARFTATLSSAQPSSYASATATPAAVSTCAHIATTTPRALHESISVTPRQLAATAPPPSTRLRSRLRSQAAAGLLADQPEDGQGRSPMAHGTGGPPTRGSVDFASALAPTRQTQNTTSQLQVESNPAAGIVRRASGTYGDAHRRDTRSALESTMTDVAQSARAAGFATEASLQPLARPAHDDTQAASVAASPPSEALRAQTQQHATVARHGTPPLDARLRDIEQRKACRALEASKSESPSAATRWTLPRVHVTALDDQHLFELNVKLQYADEEPVIVATLQELAGATVRDFPAEAFLQRDALMDTLLALMANGNASEQARSLAFAFMERLVAKLRRGLVDCVDPEMLPCYSDFEGPNAEGDCGPEEERLLRSIPQPADTASLPEWRQPSSEADTALDVGAFAHRVAVRILPCLFSEQQRSSCPAAAASLIEVLMPLLAPDPNAWGSAAAAARVEQYLSALQRVLELRIRADSEGLAGLRAAEAADTVQLLDEAPVLGPVSVHVLMLVVRFLACVPPERCADAVPQALAMRLGRLWCNPCIDALIPHWRACLDPYLPALAPDCADAGRLSIQAETALKHAQALTERAQLVLDGAAPLAEWLPQVPAAVSAIAFGQHRDLLRLVLRVLAFSAGDAEAGLAQGSNGTPECSDAAAVLLQLLQHPIATVQQQTWAVIRKMLAAPPSAQQSGGAALAPVGLLRLLSEQRTMRHLMVGCIARGDADVREAVAEALQQMLACGDDCVAQGALRWQAWLECYASSPELGRVCALADAHLQAASSAAAEEEEGELEWSLVSTLLQRLFSKSKTVRQLAAKRLVVLVAGGAGLLEDASIEDDPFRGLLDGAGPTPDAEPAAAPPPIDPTSLRITDVHNLMACVCNPDLQPALRCSAVQQLQALAGDPAHLPVLAVPSFLSQCLAEVERAVGIVHGGAAPADGEDADVEPLSIFQMQLPVACLGLLGALASQSGGVLGWLAQHTSGRVQALLPLVFHPLTMVRRAAALFLAPLVFLPACQLADHTLPRPPHAPDPGEAPPPLALGLFAQFTSSHYLPMPHRDEPLPAPAAAADDERDSASALLGEHHPEQAHLVGLLVSLGKLVRVAEARVGDEWQCSAARSQHMRKLLDNLPGDIDVSYELTRSLAGTFQLNDAASRAAYDWADAASAPSADAQAAAFTSLHSRCLSPEPTAAAFSTDGGLPAMAQALSKPPPTRQGFPAWLALLRLLEHGLAGSFLGATEVFELLAAVVPSVVATVARWSPGAAAQPDQSGLEDDSGVALVLRSRQEQRLSQPIVVATLHAFAAVLTRARLLCSAEQHVRALDLLAGVDAAGLLLNNVFANAAAEPAARLAAAAALQQIVELCAALQRALGGDAPTRPPAAKPGKQPPLDVRSGGGDHGVVVTTARDGSEAAQVLRRMHPACKALLQAIVRTVGMPQRSEDAGQMRGSDVVRIAVVTLRGICQAVPCAVWASAWSDAVGIFWLTRLLREPDTRLRCDAIHLLAALVHPAAGAMRDAVLQAWPEGATKMLALGLSPRQPPAVTAAALTFVAVAMASSSRSMPQCSDAANVPGTFGTGITDFGRETLLSREYLWDAVATRQPPPGAAPRLLAAMHALLSQRAALLPHELLQYLEAHGGDVGTLLDAMDVRRQLQCSVALARATRVGAWGDAEHCCGLQNIDLAQLAGALRAQRTHGLQLSDTPAQSPRTLAEIPHPCTIATGLADRHPEAGSLHGQSAASPSQHRSIGHSWLAQPQAASAAAPMAAAGHASAALSAVLRCSLQETKHAHAQVLCRLLCLNGVLLPAASASRTSHATAAGACASHAASDSAISACRCLVQLITRDAPPAAALQDAVGEAAAYARCSVAEAFAHALCCRPRASRRLQTAAASAFAALVATGARAAAVLTVEGGGEEAYAPAGLPGAGQDTRIGAVLAHGLLSIAAEAAEQDSAHERREPLSAIPSNRPRSPPHEAVGDRLPSGAAEAAAAARLALQPLLAFSASAKQLVLGHDVFKRWVSDAIAACDVLAARGSADEGDHGTPTRGGADATDKDASSAEKLRREDARTALAASLCLLRSLAYDSDAAKAAIAQSGVLQALHGAWRAVVVSQPLALEALNTLACVLSDSFEARHLVATEGRPPLLLRITRVVFRTGVAPPMVKAATQALRHFAAALDGTLALLKTPFVTDACKALRRATIRGDDAPCAPLLATLAAMASHGEGQRQLLRSAGPPALLDVVVELAQTSKARGTVAAAMLLLRNLCFRSDNKSFFLADPRALPLFVAQLEGAAANPESAASAASALWALLHRGERVKATLKGIPHAVATIQRCQKLCDSLIEEDAGGAAEDSAVGERVAVLRQITHSTRVVLRVLGAKG